MSASQAATPRVPFEYVVLKATPRIDRAESINVGVVVYCQAHEFLLAATHCDPDRLRLLDASADVAAIAAALEACRRNCCGGAESARVRFGRLASPRSTVVAAGPIHVGLTRDPEAELRRLMAKLVY